MNIENLKSYIKENGNEIKNYKVMCEILGESIKNGKSKVIQIENWTNYFEFDKNGHKFAIINIKENVPEILNSKDKNILSNIVKGKYSKNMFPLVKNFVGKHDLEFISKNGIMDKLNLKNNNYSLAYMYPDKFSKYISRKYKINVSVDCLNYMTSSIYKISQEKINNAFENLEKLDYIFDYDNKTLMVYNKETNNIEMPFGNTLTSLERYIYEGKLKALSNYYFRTEGKSMEDYLKLINFIKEKCNNDIVEMNKKLNVELFNRGLIKYAHDIALLEINNSPTLSYIKNFFYVYSYIKNEDIEWDKEIIDIAKENVHLDNYKNQVRENFMLETFLDTWFDEKHDDKSKDVNKSDFMTLYDEHKKEFKKQIDLLFKILTSKNNKYNISTVDLFSGKRDIIPDVPQNDELPF